MIFYRKVSKLDNDGSGWSNSEGVQVLPTSQGDLVGKKRRDTTPGGDTEAGPNDAGDGVS